jgi:hypothetical protein
MIAALLIALAAQELPPGAKLVLHETWAEGRIDPARWYVPRKHWGQGNQGVIPENVRVENGVLVCEAHGDLYDGPRVGWEGVKARVGGALVSKAFYASGRFEVAIRIGSTAAIPGGPADPARPIGAVPAIWTYAYRYVSVGKERMKDFVAEAPLYNPLMERYQDGTNEYWSEIDFPEFGKAGLFERGMYNSFCQTKEFSETFDVGAVIDGKFHTLTTDWRTTLVPLDGVTDAQVVEHSGFWWIKDASIPFNRYLGNPLRKLGKDRYSACMGEKALHWIDGKKVAETKTFVPCMAAQLTLGVWLPNWGGPAPWKTAPVSFGPIRIWQYGDAGDVRGVLTEDLKDNFGPDGAPRK